MYLSRGDTVAKHEFGIIDSFEENKWYSDYEPENIIVFLSVTI